MNLIVASPSQGAELRLFPINSLCFQPTLGFSICVQGGSGRCQAFKPRTMDLSPSETGHYSIPDASSAHGRTLQFSSVLLLEG